MLAKQSFPILEAQRRHSEKSILNSGLNNVQCRDKIVFAPLQGKIRRNYFYLPPAAGEMVGQCQNNFWLGYSYFGKKSRFCNELRSYLWVPVINSMHGPYIIATVN